MRNFDMDFMLKSITGFTILVFMNINSVKGNISGACSGDSCGFDIDLSIPNVNITTTRLLLQQIQQVAADLKPNLTQLENDASKEGIIVHSELQNVQNAMRGLFSQISSVNDEYAETVAEMYKEKEKLDLLQSAFDCFEVTCFSRTQTQTTTTALPNGCISSPCANGGTCSAILVPPYYACQCYDWYNGTQCETVNCDVLQQLVYDHPPNGTLQSITIPPIGNLTGGFCGIVVGLIDKPQDVQHRIGINVTSVSLMGSSSCDQSFIQVNEYYYTGFGDEKFVEIAKFCPDNQTLTFKNNINTTDNMLHVLINSTGPGVMARVTFEYHAIEYDACSSLDHPDCCGNGICNREYFSATCDCKSGCYSKSSYCCNHVRSPCPPPPLNRMLCGNHGSCAYNTTTCTDRRCVCDHGYYGNMCHDTSSSTSSTPVGNLSP